MEAAGEQGWTQPASTGPARSGAELRASLLQNDLVQRGRPQGGARDLPAPPGPRSSRGAATQQAASADGFVASYRELLCAGGTERYDVALQRFGLDPRDPAFWSMGLDMISGMIDELEGLS